MKCCPSLFISCLVYAYIDFGDFQGTSETTAPPPHKTVTKDPYLAFKSINETILTEITKPQLDQPNDVYAALRNDEKPGQTTSTDLMDPYSALRSIGDPPPSNVPALTHSGSPITLATGSSWDDFTSGSSVNSSSSNVFGQFSTAVSSHTASLVPPPNTTSILPSSPTCSSSRGESGWADFSQPISKTTAAASDHFDEFGEFSTCSGLLAMPTTGYSSSVPPLLPSSTPLVPMNAVPLYETPSPPPPSLGADNKYKIKVHAEQIL